jgi:hypothetical protein
MMQQRARHTRIPTLLALALAAALALGAGPWTRFGEGSPLFFFQSPAFGQLSLPGDVAFSLRLPPLPGTGTPTLRLDGEPIAPAGLTRSGRVLEGALEGLPEGPHALSAEVRVRVAFFDIRLVALTRFELVALDRPEECEILNQVSCVLPFPSSRFLEPADTETGYRVAFGPTALPTIARLTAPGGTGPLDPAPYRQNDGFSPTAQILMHFPGGLDPALSNAPRLDPGTGFFDLRGLDPDSPTLLMDYQTGERINHFVENDARADDPERELTFLRPAESLVPGRRYVVAVRHVLDAAGQPLEAEAVFAAIRDGHPSTIPAVEERREALEPVLRRLRAFGVRRHELVLAFDFVVQSDRSLTHEMLAMRDHAFAWFAEQQALGVPTFTVDEVDEVNPGCADPEQAVWRIVEGTFRVPLFLTGDPIAEPRLVAFMRRDAGGTPEAEGFTDPPYGIAIPCAVFDAPGGFAPLPPLLVGHGLFGEGPGTVRGLTQAEALADFRFVAGGTNWSGLSTPDITAANIANTFVVRVLGNLDLIDALADRLRQGQLHTLVLARMLRSGVFNEHPAFQNDAGEGVLPVEEELYYFGASLGGIMGTMFAALTPDAERLNVDVPAINFSLLLQRATPFLEFQLLLGFVNADAMAQAILLSLAHEIWVRGEPAGYATHVTQDPLPGSLPKRILMTVALHDQQVSNLGSLLAGRTLRLPNLRGSALSGLPGLPDAEGPLDSAFVLYDTGSFDPAIPEHRPFIPPPANLQAAPNRCDPHGLRGFIPASVEQLLTFLMPDGQVVNFCSDDGICNASEPFEIPFGADAPCDPL